MAFDGTFSAGTAAPGESITMVTKLIAHRGVLHLLGGRVFMGDPLVEDDPDVSSIIFEKDDRVGVQPTSWSVAKQLYR